MYEASGQKSLRAYVQIWHDGSTIRPLKVVIDRVPTTPTLFSASAEYLPSVTGAAAMPK